MNTYPYCSLDHPDEGDQGLLTLRPSPQLCASSLLDRAKKMRPVTAALIAKHLKRQTDIMLKSTSMHRALTDMSFGTYEDGKDILCRNAKKMLRIVIDT